MNWRRAASRRPASSTASLARPRYSRRCGARAQSRPLQTIGAGGRTVGQHVGVFAAGDAQCVVDDLAEHDAVVQLAENVLNHPRVVVHHGQPVVEAEVDGVDRVAQVLGGDSRGVKLSSSRGRPRPRRRACSMSLRGRAEITRALSTIGAAGSIRFSAPGLAGFGGLVAISFARSARNRSSSSIASASGIVSCPASRSSRRECEQSLDSVAVGRGGLSCQRFQQPDLHVEIAVLTERTRDRFHVLGHCEPAALRRSTVRRCRAPRAGAAWRPACRGPPPRCPAP